MSDLLTCPQGHQWRRANEGEAGEPFRRHACPKCGEAALTLDASPLTESPQASTLPISPVASERPSIPGYQIEAELGRGGMGIVYRAWQTSLKRSVALKMIRGGHAVGEEVERFRREAEAVARLQHPNIVQIHEVGEWQGADGVSRPYFSLEYVDGGSLAQRLARLGRAPEPPGVAAEMIETLARAVHAAHQRGIVHRDLKPANVLLTLNGTPKIADFGPAKQLDDDASRTRSGAILGTPSYMAPEQAAGKVKEITTATDVYSLGAILYELVTGRPPFRGETLLETLEQVRSQEPVPPSRLQPRLPRDLVTICLKCLQKEPRQRYGSAEALADDLRRFRNGETILARPVGRLERTYRWCRRNPAAVLVLGVVLLAGAAVSVTGWWSYHAVREQLYESLCQQSRALWLAREPGWREQSLKAIQRAAAIRAEPRLRDLAVQTLVTWDFRPDQEWPLAEGHPASALAVDPSGRHCAAAVADGVQLRDLIRGVELGNITVSEPITQLTYHPHGALLAGAAGSHAQVWNVKERTRLHQLGPHRATVQDVAFGPGPDTLSSTDGMHLYVWDLQSGRLLSRDELAVWQPAVPAEPEGIKLKPKPAHGGSKPSTLDKSPRFQLRTGLLAMADQENPAPAPIPGIAAKPRPRQVRLAAGLRDAFVIAATADAPPQLWRFADGKLTQTKFLRLPSGDNVRVVLSADERVLFLACNEPRNLDFLLPQPLKVEPKKPSAYLVPGVLPEPRYYFPLVGTLLQQPPELHPVQPVLPAETVLAAPTGGVGVPAGLFGPHGGVPVQAATPSATVISGVDAVPRSGSDAGLLGRSGPELTAYLFAFDLESGKASSTSAVLGAVRGLAVGRDGQLFMPADTGRVGLFVRRNGELGRAGDGPLHAGPGELVALAISPDGRRVVSSSQNFSMRTWQFEGTELSDVLHFRGDDWCEFAFSGDERVLATARWQKGTIELSGMDGRRPPWRVQRDGVTVMALAADGERLFFNRRVGWQGLFAVRRPLNAADGEEPGEPEAFLPEARQASEFRFVTFALSPDGGRIALGGMKPAVVIRDAHEPGFPVLAHFGDKDQVVFGLAYSADGSLLAGAATDGAAHVWTADGNKLARFGSPGHRVSALAVSPDARFLAAGAEDGHVTVWNVQDQAEVASMQIGGGLSALAFSRDSAVLLGGDREGTVFVWEHASSTPAPRWRGHTSEVVKVLHHDHDTLISCARNGAIYRWRLDRIREGLLDLGLKW